MLNKPDIHSQYGMRFLLDCIKKCKDLNINMELVHTLFSAVTNIHYQQEAASVPVPEEDPEKEEQDPALEKEIEDAIATNEEIKIRNE